MKSAGKRSRLRLICSLKRLVGTPYSAAKSASSSTFWPRSSRMRWTTVSSGNGAAAGPDFTSDDMRRLLSARSGLRIRWGKPEKVMSASWAERKNPCQDAMAQAWVLVKCETMLRQQCNKREKNQCAKAAISKRKV
jgi:hypothetical protein